MISKFIADYLINQWHKSEYESMSTEYLLMNINEYEHYVLHNILPKYYLLRFIKSWLGIK